MFKFIKDKISKAGKSRGAILIVIFGILAFVLIQKLFNLQIINGESYLTDFTMRIKKEKTIKSTRGEIFDRNGYPLAYNKLAYSVTFEDNGSYTSIHERNLSLNSSMYGLLRVIEDNGGNILTDFGIILGDSNEYEYTKTGTSLLRFKADIYGKAYIEDMSDEQTNATAGKLVEDMCNHSMYGVYDPSEYTDEELTENGLPTSGQMTKEVILKLCIMRSKIAANSYQKYMATTLAKDINEKTMSIIMENKDIFDGVDVVEDSLRVYNDSIYFAPLLGYTGQVSQEELEVLNADGNVYSSNDIVGKTGLEKSFESELQGVDGSETLYVDNLGKVLMKDSEVAPQAGDDIYLTIDKDLQIAAYKILEQYIAGIVYTNMVDEKEFHAEWASSSDDIRIPVYDAYYALFENNILDAKHLAAKDATENEKRVYLAFLAKQKDVFQEIKTQMTTANPTAYKDYTNLEDEQWKAYMSYIVNNLLTEQTGILNSDAIDKNDKTYKAWTEEESISLQEYLDYAIAQGWLDVSKIGADSSYMDNAEINRALADFFAEKLADDDTFSRQIYKYMIMEESLSGTDVCLLLYDQGILEQNDQSYNALASGSISAYDFIRSKILNLELTPGELALEPCSGSVVITDPANGDVLACVTYPGYDNNRLANSMDTDYYYKLNGDLSSPFYNKATQEVTAPGSTFKLVSATAGVEEGVISIYDTINCKGQFDLLDPTQPINCWIYSSKLKAGAHGPLTMKDAIKESCNYYFNTIGFLLGKDGTANGEYNDELGIKRLSKYAKMYGFDAKSGIEIDEMSPHIADYDTARSAMGQSNHAYTTSQLARYVNTLANSGTCYDLTLLDKITDAAGTVLDEPEPVVHNQLALPQDLWDTLHSGMNAVVNNNSALKEMKTKYKFDMAGKTGTAQQSTDKANHALFIGYAPYDNPEMAIAVRITNGYTSRNAAMVARDIVKYRFQLEDENQIITGSAASVGAGNTSQD